MSDTSVFVTFKDRLLKITAALYRVTDLFQDEEPLKWSLRRTAMDVLDNISKDAEGVSISIRIKNLDNVIDLIQVIEHKLFLAQAGGFVSRLNFEVLGREYGSVRQELMGCKAPIIESETKLLDLPVSDTKAISSPTRAISVNEQPSQNGKIPTRSSSSINERQNRILLFLEGKEWLGLGDIAGPLYGDSVSAKTVQRDLNDLLSRGLIRSQGERRWRQYASLPKHGIDQVINTKSVSLI